MLSESEESLHLRLRDLIAEADLQRDRRLPPERALCAQLGVSRGHLRSALATLESEGHIWRHVGKGTFAGRRPIAASDDPEVIARSTNPAEVMRTRLLIEPDVAGLAALHATAADVEEMRICLKRSRGAANWRDYESWDDRLHRVIAGATRNVLLLALIDTVSSVRRAVTWGRLRGAKSRPDPDHHSFAEHDAIVAAIVERDTDRARELMREHLQQVERNHLSPGNMAGRLNGARRPGP